MIKKILLASPRGFCAGVDRAIAIVKQALEKYGAPIYVRHEVVHNKFVVDELTQKGAIFIEDIALVPDNGILIYSAHGVPLSVHNEANNRNLKLILDATCPLVSKVHVEVKNLHNNGYYILMIGHKGHPEVEGTMGQVKSNISLIENLDDVNSLLLSKSIDKLAVVTQTTLSIDETKLIIDKLKDRYPNIKLPKKDDICYATQNRQEAVKDMVNKIDMLLVIGSKNSSNSNRLKELAQHLGVKSYLIDFDYEIETKWLENVDVVGVTAGASAPELLVLGVINKLKSYGFGHVEEHNTIAETMEFALPVELRN